MTALAPVPTAPQLRTRSTSIDRLRGLAIVLMIGDHLALFYGFDLYRETLGRVAMPLFFVLSGYLVRRLSWRTFGVGLVGLALPLVVPWIDNPNVLLWYAVGAFFLWMLERCRLSLAAVVVVALGAASNGYLDLWGSSYAPGGLLGLMAFGQLLRVLEWSPFDSWARWCPSWLALLGRFPLSWYVGHLALIEITRQLVLRVL